jgi:hypothetical protein
MSKHHPHPQKKIQISLSSHPTSHVVMLTRHLHSSPHFHLPFMLISISNFNLHNSSHSNLNQYSRAHTGTSPCFEIGIFPHLKIESMRHRVIPSERRHMLSAVVVEWNGCKFCSLVRCEWSTCYGELCKMEMMMMMARASWGEAENQLKWAENVKER